MKFYLIKGCEKNLEMALKYYAKAADGGCGKSQYNLGCIYATGEIVKKDKVKALRYFKAALQSGIEQAKTHIEKLESKEPDENELFSKGEIFFKEKDYVKAEQSYSKAANLGNIEAMLKLGNIYQNGLGFAKDGQAAIKWYKKAADLGNVDGQYGLAVMYRTAAFENYDECFKCYSLLMRQGKQLKEDDISYLEKKGKKNHPDVKFPQAWIDNEKLQEWNQTGNTFYKNGDFLKASAYYQMAAENGLKEAQFSLAVCFMTGKGVTQNIFVGILLYHLACVEAHGKSEFNLGTIFEEGKVIPKDFRKAAMFFRLAESHGITNASAAFKALFQNPELNLKNINDLFPPTQEVAASIHKEAIMHLNKTGPEKAFPLFVEAGYNFYPESLYQLGRCFNDGKATKLNVMSAYFCFRLAADLGNGDSAYEVGKILEEGDIVPKNIISAKKYFTMAVKAKVPNAKSALENLDDFKKYKLSDNFISVEYYKYAISKGDVDGMVCMGLCSENGTGVKKDLNEATKYYENATKAGSSFAKKKLKELKK